MHKSHTAYQPKHLVTMVTIWICFGTRSPGNLMVIKSTMNSYVYQKCYRRTSDRQIDLGWNDVWNSTNLQQNCCNIKESRPSQSPDLSIIEMVWKDLKRPGHYANLNKLKKHEWVSKKSLSTVGETHIIENTTTEVIATEDEFMSWAASCHKTTDLYCESFLSFGSTAAASVSRDRPVSEHQPVPGALQLLSSPTLSSSLPLVYLPGLPGCPA